MVNVSPKDATGSELRGAQVSIIEERDQDGMRLAEFDLAHHGRTVTGVLFQPLEPCAGAPLVCFGHGASGDRYQLPIPWLAKRLVAEHGFFGLSIDGPVHGRRKVGDGGRHALWAEWQREGSIEDMVADWKLSLDYVQSLPQVGAGPVGYWGLSMGTIFGLPFVAAHQDELRAAVLGLMGVAGPTSERIERDAKSLRADLPVLFLLQRDDELFALDQGLALFDAFGTSDKRLHLNVGAHSAVPVDEFESTQAFLARHLLG